MENSESLFLKIIDKLDSGGVLQDIVLIGSWALPVYREYFDDDPEIPILRTTDVDFLLGMPPNIRSAFDIPAALSEIGFEHEWSLQGDFCKYVHPDLEVEFLIPEYGRGAGRSVAIPTLGIRAQPLRFLSLAYNRSMCVSYHGYNIRVPEPEVFVLLKLLILPRRKDNAKRMKDAYTARTLGEFLLKRIDRRVFMQTLFNELPKGWQKKIRSVSKNHFPALLDIVKFRPY
mgnify:CR=1 FL=1